MKCARSKKRSQNISSNYVQSTTPKFNCSKVTLMKFRNSLFNKQQRRRKSFIRTSIQSESDDYSRLETERISNTLPSKVPQKSKTNCNSGNSCNDTDPNKLLRSGDVESNPGPTPVNKDSQKGRPKKKGFKGTPVKPQSTYADVAKTGSIVSANTSLMTTNSQYPVGLLNNNENICFFKFHCSGFILYSRS